MSEKNSKANGPARGNIPTVALRDPSHLVASLPYLMGFEPQRSLVIMGMKQTGSSSQVIVTARYDLPELTDHVTANEIVEHVAAAFSSGRQINSALIAVVADEPGHIDREQPYTALVDDLIYALDDNDIAVKDAVYTHDGVVHIYGCTDPSWPWHGVRISQEERDTVAAGFVFAGIAPATTREDLYAEISQVGDQLTADVAALIDANEHSVTGLTPEVISEIAHEISQTLASASRLSAKETARIGIAFDNVRIRDAVLWDLAHASGDERAVARANLTQAMRHLPDEHAPHVAVVLGIEQWMHGDGARANIATERALATNPDHSMGRMLEQSLRMGMPPSAFAEMFMTSLSREACTGEVPGPSQARTNTPPATTGPDTAIAL